MLENNRKLVSIDSMFGSMSDDKVKDFSLKTEDIEIEKLVPYKNHPFKLYDGKRLEDLKQSIKDLGIINPIVVRNVGLKYEILAGHNRANAAREVGLKTLPAIVKENLSEDEALLIVTESNLIQRSFKDLTHSERARVLTEHYNAISNKNIRKTFLSEISEEIKSLSNPYGIRAEDTLSPVETGGENGLRKAANNYDLSKDTVARYLRIDKLINSLKEYIDDESISIRAGVNLSYICEDNQIYIVDVINNNKVKLDIKKSEMLRTLEEKGKLNEESIIEVLVKNKELKKAGRPQMFKMQKSIITKYFKKEDKQEDIEEIIDKALEEYFERND